MYTEIYSLHNYCPVPCGEATSKNIFTGIKILNNAFANGQLSNNLCELGWRPVLEVTSRFKIAKMYIKYCFLQSQ